MASAAADAGAAGPGGAPSPPCPPCPPYPPHELARLVLGYLEEEQCMSAYEEFIKSSPYLDTYRTDYMMTSLTSFTLKHIFNEYCAFKIYTRSCKPPALRRKLLQCRTLLDMAKVLVAHVDLNKLQNETPVDTHYKSGSNFIAPNPQNVLKTKECEVCKAIDNIDGCQCKVRRPILPNLFATPFKIDLQQAAVLTRMPLETLVETTQLSDLPGTSAAKKKSTDKEQPQQPSFYNAANNRSDSGPVIVRVEPAVSEERLCDQSAASSVSQVKAKPAPLIGAQTLSSKTTDLMGCTDITGTLTVVDRSSNTKASLMQAALAVETAGNLAVDAAARPAIMDRSFHQFASGAGGEGSNTTSSEAMPDSSTPETNIQAVRHNPSTKTYPASSIVLNPTPTRILPGYQKLISGSESSFTPDRQHSNSSSDVDMSRNSILCSSSTKFYEPKITIISNDIVKPIEEDGKLFISDATGEKCALKLLPGKPVGVNKFTKLTTSNAIIQVNGTPAYNGQPKSQKFTKEQIMAMPTVILVQSSNASTTTLNTTSAVTSAPMSAVPVDSGYRPLTIDVESTSEGVNNTEPDMIQPTKSTIESRTFIASDEIPNATVSMEKLSTPNVPRLVKKSSSTPRRTSHVRVLDFTTPRRILVGSCESLAENTTTGARTMTLTSITEFSQPDASMEGPIENQQEKKETEEKKNLEPLKKAKKDWDADLRALVVDSVPAETRKKSHRKKRKSPGDSSKENDDYHNKSKGKKVKKKSAKATKDKIVTLVVDEPQKAIVKPTINVVTDWKTASKENGTNAELPVSENNVTPEIDHRPPTANPPSAKHNFSDLFLQTPIKMILENIQMQTPRFLDPSILDQPISDIKIDNIQTPNFFNTPNFAMTPKAVGATPSSYNSRPTDYSSGGSYYRPDEHDYVPPIDFLPSDLQSDPQPQESKDIETKTLNDQDQDQELEDESIARSSRPRRQCTLKKVSYFDHPNTKDKNTRDKSLESVASLDTSGNAPTSDSSEEFIRKQSVEPHSFIQTKENINSKEELRLSIEEKRVRTIAALKKKSPMKNYKRNSTNNVSKMVNCGKITPRRPTPKVALNKKKPSPRKSVQSKDSTRKKSVSKDKPSTITPTMVPAPPKSRRKSSTPRKLQTQRFNANSIDDSASADIIKADKQVAPCDTEDELPPLRMSSEEGSRDSKCKRVIDYLAYREENDEIIQIKAYIEKSSEMTEPMYVDLIQRGFDMETAKRIERDLLGTPHRSPQESLRMENENEIPGKPYLGQEICNQNVDIANTVENIPAQIKYQEITANTSVSRDSSNAIKDNNANDSSQEQSSQKQNSIVIEGDIELSMCNVDEKSDNYFCCTFDETQPRNNAERITINDDFALEIDCEDYPGIKIQLIKFATVLDMPPKVLREENHPETSRCEARSISEEVPEEANEEEQIETVNAVDSIAHMTPLYTPIKDAMDKQCLEIFDSTLNSLDTPIKPNSPTKSRTSHNVIEEMDLTICSSKYSPTAKRKRSESPVESSTKKSRPEPKYLPIQNFDIESVLSKLHGP